MKEQRIKAELSLSILHRANRSELKYALLRNHRQVMAGTAKDLDILIASRDRCRLVTLIRESVRKDPDWMIFQIMESRYGSRVVLFHREDYSLLFDLQSVVNCGTGLAPAEYFLDRTTLSGEGIRLPGSLDYFIALALHNEIKSKPEYTSQIAAAFEETPGLEREVREKIADLKERYSIGPVRKAWLKITAVSAFRRYIFPAGLFVVVNGPDGVGKTSALNVLQDRLTGLKISHRIKHLGGKTGILPGRPASLPRKQGSADISPSTAVDSRSLPSRIFTFLRFIYHFLDIWLYYWLVIRRYQARGGVFLADKYFTYTIKSSEMGFSISPRLLIAAYHLLPRPNIFLLFWNTPEVIVERKQELTPREAACHIRSLEELGLHSRRLVKIKTDGTIASVADRVLECVADYIRGRNGN